MDIELRTHTTNPALALRDLDRWVESPPLSAGWRATLALRSGAFSAELPFYFDESSLDEFIQRLAAMDRTLHGSALLQTPNEDPHILLTVSPAGHVSVRGILIDFEHDYQRLEFVFGADQTVLRPLIDDFEAARRVLAAPTGRAS